MMPSFTTNTPGEAPRIQATLEALARGWPGPGTWWQDLLRRFGAPVRPTFPMPNRTPIGPNARPLHVAWTTEPILHSPGVTGWTEVPAGVVHVLVRPLPQNDALAHELVHWALFHLTGNADPDHEQTRFGTQWTQAHNDLIRAVDNQTRTLRATPQVHA